MNDIELAEQVKNWFKSQINNKHKWARTETGKVIREEIKKLNNWKNAPRGNPVKGGRIARDKKMKSQAENF